MTSDEPQAAGDRPAPPREGLTLDTRSLRAIAHPVRVRLLTLLREHGASTATRLAERLGLNSGATSYHLRQLAAAGLVEEDVARGNARERWWRSAHRSTFFEPYDLPAADRAAGAVYLDAIAAEYADRVRQAAHEYLTFPDEWQRSGDMSDFRMLLTPTEAARLIQELHAVIATYRGTGAPAEDVPADARVVVAQVQVMPQLAHAAGVDAATGQAGLSTTGETEPS